MTSCVETGPWWLSNRCIKRHNLQHSLCVVTYPYSIYLLPAQKAIYIMQYSCISYILVVWQMLECQLYISWATINNRSSIIRIRQNKTPIIKRVITIESSVSNDTYNFFKFRKWMKNVAIYTEYNIASKNAVYSFFYGNIHCLKINMIFP